MKQKHTVEITEYKNWLIITVRNYGPKIKVVGTGLLFSDFNHTDLLISNEALSILKNNINLNTDKKSPVLEIIAGDRMWWASTQGILIPPDEYFHIYTMPQYTVCDNHIDEVIQTVIDNKK